MNSRTYIAGFLVFSCLVIPLVQLSFGFRYVDYPDSCPGQQDIMLLMAIGGFFEIIAFALSFRCIYDLAPSKYKETKSKPSGEISSKESQRAQKILICKKSEDEKFLQREKNVRFLHFEVASRRFYFLAL